MRRTLRLVPTVAFLGFAMLLAGCVGASASGAILGIVLLVSAVGLQACLGGQEEAAADAEADCRTPCGDPCGVSCNYWSDTETVDTAEPFETVEPVETIDALDDGDCWTPCGEPCGTSCNYWPDTETDAEVTTCDGTMERACENGAVVELCCPAGMACNYGELMIDCGDGTCVDQPDTCEKPQSCDGTMERACENGAVVELCCPAGMACNYGQLMIDCGDGTCVDQPDTCEPKGCDGTMERACENGAVVELCCPAGMACNYGQLMVDCGGGACVNLPEICPADR